MMDYTLLVVDDDEPIHIMTDNLLGDDYELVHAKNAQEAIDILSEQAVNLILSDIHMPGMSGLEFLESLMKDAEKQDIPVLIMTNLPTVEKEKKALDLGAADFIKKTLFNEDKEEIRNRVRMKLVTNVQVPDLDRELSHNKEKLVSMIMAKAIEGDFDETVKHLCEEIHNRFNTGYVGFWTLENDAVEQICSVGDTLPEDYTPDDLTGEETFQQISERREPYMTNHIFNDELGIMKEYSREEDLPAEIGVPIFSIDERNLLMNNMQIPEDAFLFGYLVLKRNNLFATKEYEVISRLIVQAGSILWRLRNQY